MMKKIDAQPKSHIRYMYDEDASGVVNGKPYKGIVICFLDDVGNDAQEFIWNVWDCTLWENKMSINHRYKAIAYCSTEDKFDLTTGMNVARAKVLHSYNVDKRNAYEQFIKKEFDRCNRVIAEINSIQKRLDKDKEMKDKND